LSAAHQVRVYLGWWSGDDDSHRAELDSYLDCLLLDSNFASIFDSGGGVQLSYGGSVNVPARPAGNHVGICDGDTNFVNSLIAGNQWPAPASGQPIPLYLFLAPDDLTVDNCYSNGQCPGACTPVCHGTDVCGLNGGQAGYYNGLPWLAAWTNATGCCYSASTPGRPTFVSSMSGTHEMEEIIAGMLGINRGGASGDDNACEGASVVQRLTCPNRSSVIYGVQKFDKDGGYCNFRPSIVSNSCAPTGWGCGQDSDCCLGHCNGSNGLGGTVCSSGGVQCVNNPGVGNNCGNESVISGGDPNTLYHCNGPGAATLVAHCAYGCKHNPPGVDDVCYPPPVLCVNNPGVGNNCGDESVISGGNANTLYHCNGAGPATVVETCSAGCVHRPPGIDDVCNHATCVNNPGVGNNCGNESVISNGFADVLYHCNGAGTAQLLRICANGCQDEPPGVDDVCR
jgi:hypothetical protein